MHKILVGNCARQASDISRKVLFTKPSPDPSSSHVNQQKGVRLVINVLLHTLTETLHPEVMFELFELSSNEYRLTIIIHCDS